MFFGIAWVVQTLVAYFIPVVLALLLAGRINERDTVMWDIANYAFFALSGLVLGTLAAGIIPGWTGSGKWVWIGPVGLLVFSALLEIFSGHFDIITLWFGRGEAGWVSAFVTCPALACCTYSVLMAWRYHKRNRP